MNRISRMLVGSMLSLAAASTAQAQLLGSSYSITAGNGFTNGAQICKTGSAAGTVSANPLLAAADWTGGCVGYYSATLTTVANQNFLTFTVLEGGNYSWADFNLNFTSGPQINSVSFVGYNRNFFEPTYGYNQSNFAPTVSNTSSSININWNTGDDALANQFRFDDNGVGIGQAVFQINSSNVVPEPSSILLVASGLLAFGLIARRRNA